MMDFIEQSSIFFSMVSVDTGIPKISTRPAGFVSVEQLDPNADPEYFVYYQFSPRDTNKVGRYQAQFLFRNDQGTMILPIREELYVNVQESFIAFFKSNWCGWDSLPPGFQFPVKELVASLVKTQRGSCINSPFLV